MVKVVKGLEGGWGVCSRTTQLGSYPVTLSHHNNSVAVGSESGDINILNVITGSQSAVLSGHTKKVNCVVFSSDGTSLVSGSDDMAVKLWDIQTGGVIKTFFGHAGGVYSVSITVGWTMIASGSGDQTIRLWVIQTGECYHTIQQQGMVSHVQFSPKIPQNLISVSDNKVWWWDVNGCQIRPPFNGSNVAFSSDGTQFISCYIKTITVHDSSSGVIVAEFQTAEYATQCCFSPCNRLVAVAAEKTVCYWDITTSNPQPVKTFVGHFRMITSVIFSSSATLISASYDGSINFWQIGAIIDLEPTSPSMRIESVILQPKEGVAITLDSGSAINSWDISTGICKKSHKFPVKHFDQRDIQLANGKLIFVWCMGGVHVWDAEDGQLLWKVAAPQGTMWDIKISGDKSKVFGLCGNFLWAWSLWAGEVVGKIEVGGLGTNGSLLVDGSKVWAHWRESMSSIYKGWDFGIPGSAPIELPNQPTPTYTSRIWNPVRAGIKDRATGKVVFQLPKRFSNPVSVQCDDSYLVAGYESGEILILDLTNVT